MAIRNLRLIFEDAVRAGKEVLLTIPKCDDTVTPTIIKAAMQAIYDNKEAFDLDIGAIKAAKFVTPMSLTDVELPA